MSEAVLLARLRAEFGAEAVETSADGIPRVLPRSAQAVADLCGLAFHERLRVRIEGRGTWLPPDAPADLVLSTSRLGGATEIAPADLVASAGAGTSFRALQEELAQRGVWLGLDPPGTEDRTLGSVIATGTAGPLAHGLGPVRDHLLGLEVVAGDGRMVRSGGKVVKNVAGYDLTRVQAGAFGAFGIVTAAHLRLRALPRHRIGLLARGPRDRLTRAARELNQAGLTAAALELASGTPEWLLLAEFTGTREAVEAEAERAGRSGELAWSRLATDRLAALRDDLAGLPLAGPITFRLGVFTDGLDETIDLLEAELGPGSVTAGAGRGSLRWSGSLPAGPRALQSVRRTLAEREIPLTLERAPWSFRRVVGHFGEYREGVSGLVSRLREVYDPGLVFRVALDGEPVS